MKKEAIIIHSGGMDSSITLAIALEKFPPERLLSLSFSYRQRHVKEIKQAAKIAKAWKVDHEIIEIDFLAKISGNALTRRNMAIEHKENNPPNTLVIGRNGLMTRIAAMRAWDLGADMIYVGVMEYEDGNSGYRDCSRKYMDLMENILRIDLNNPRFKIVTPLVHMSKKDSLKIAHRLGILAFLLEETISCYEGIGKLGCRRCPACLLRNNSLRSFAEEHRDIALPYAVPLSG